MGVLNIGEKSAKKLIGEEFCPVILPPKIQSQLPGYVNKKIRQPTDKGDGTEVFPQI